MDTEKPFDNLNWEFIITMLEKMKFGNRFVDAIKGIYREQRSYLAVNEERTEGFPIWKGTQQGCPLSPLLFILVLEVMLKRVQQNKEIIGLDLNKYKYKYRTCAGDVMFILEDPLITLSLLLKEVKIFGELAGFHINYKKTKVMCKNMTNTEGKKTTDNNKM